MTITPEQCGAIGDGIADDTAALNAADASPSPVYLTPGKTYRANGQLLLGQSNGKRWYTDGARGSATILSDFNGGKCILIGSAVDTTLDVEFAGIKFVQGAPSTQVMFEARGVRGVHFKNCKFENLYYGFDLGTATRVCTIFELVDCELNMRPGHLHLLNVVNCRAQIEVRDSFIEGAFSPGSSGLRIDQNLAGTVDHIVFTGGYFGRFDTNFDIAQRVVNFQMGADLLTEGHLTAGVRFRNNASFEGVTIKSQFGLGAGPWSLWQIMVDYTQTQQNCLGFKVDGASFQRVINQPAIEFKCPAGMPAEAVQLINLNFPICVDNSDNNHAVVELWQVRSGIVNNLAAICPTSNRRFAYVVRAQACSGVLIGADIIGHGFASGAASR